MQFVLLFFFVVFNYLDLQESMIMQYNRMKGAAILSTLRHLLHNNNIKGTYLH